MLRLEVVEDAAKDHLGEEELITRADLACDTALHLDDVVGARETQSAEDALAALELVELEDVVDLGDLLLERPDVRGLVHFGLVESVDFIELRGGVEWRGEEEFLERPDFLREERVSE